MRVALVNTNRIYPPVAPIGLDYVAEALRASGHRPELLDLCWEERWGPGIGRVLANGGIGGEGEFALAELAGRLEKKLPWDDVPGLVARRGGTWQANPGSDRPLTHLPPVSRDFPDNPRYFREGGQAGI